VGVGPSVGSALGLESVAKGLTLEEEEAFSDGEPVEAFLVIHAGATAAAPEPCGTKVLMAVPRPPLPPIPALPPLPLPARPGTGKMTLGAEPAACSQKGGIFSASDRIGSNINGTAQTFAGRQATHVWRRSLFVLDDICILHNK